MAGMSGLERFDETLDRGRMSRTELNTWTLQSTGYPWYNVRRSIRLQRLVELQTGRPETSSAKHRYRPRGDCRFKG